MSIKPVSNLVSIAYPPMDEGQDGWELYHTSPKYRTPPDNRNLFQKGFYAILVWMYDHKIFWRWAYKQMFHYRKPPPERDGEHVILLDRVKLT